MHPIVSPATMRAVDAAAAESTEVLVARAGWAVARSAREMMGGSYGRRVALFVGPGNNGADGRAAAKELERWGVRCETISTGSLERHLEQEDPRITRAITSADLIIDACYGTGYRLRNGEEFRAPNVGGTPVLAVDIPSGVEGLTGAVAGQPFRATRTVTFVAPKPGLMLWPGACHVGTIEIADIGLVPRPSNSHWMEESDLTQWPQRPATAHKWQSAVWVIGGSPGMTGAPQLAAAGAARAGAGYVLVSTPGVDPAHASSDQIETVHRALPGRWMDDEVARSDRIGALVVGPGLATSERDNTLELISHWPGPMVVDGGALASLAGQQELLRSRTVTPILTPHDGELARLIGRKLDPAEYRIRAAVILAADYGSVVLLKGPTTIVAAPDGRSWLSTAGDSRLATAGTGDVLAGIIAAGLALGLAPEIAASLGAELHGRAAQSGPNIGLAASQLPDLVADYLSAR